MIGTDSLSEAFIMCTHWWSTIVTTYETSSMKPGIPGKLEPDQAQ
jgi:hypothetical protein